jgi:hypothetical protein
VVSEFEDDFGELLQDTLTVEIFTPGTEDPLTGAATGGSSVIYLSQPCADEDVLAGRRAQFKIAGGVAGSIPVSICLTAWFASPVLTSGQSVAYRVNGRYRPLLKQGPPTDMGAQQGAIQLPFGPPESGR